MEQNLMKTSTRLPGFVEDAYDTIEKMQQFSQLLLDSKLCPDHLYEKKNDGKRTVPDYSKGKVPAVMMILMQGHQLNLPPLTALQHIIPVNGLLSIKGDAAKSMIFSSGKLKKDSWNEKVEGSIEKGDLKVTITATREDNGETLSRSFSVEQAKRAGLWVSEQDLRGDDGWKKKKSAWWKYPARMISYRALGFISRDLFPDVLSGIYTTEEAIDMPQDESITIDVGDGKGVTIPDPEFNKERSSKLTSRAVDKINRLNDDKDPISNVPVKPEDAQEFNPQKYKNLNTTVKHYPVTPDEAFEQPVEKDNSIPTMYNGIAGFIKVLPEEELKNLDSKSIMLMINQDGLMRDAVKFIPGRNTNKKLREIILAKYEDRLLKMIQKSNPDYPVYAEDQPQEPEDDIVPTDEGTDQAAYEAGVEEEVNQEQEQETVNPSNKYNIDIPELGETGARTFDEAKTLFDDLANIAGLSDDVFLNLVVDIEDMQGKYKTREEFCFNAPVEHIKRLVNIC